MITYKKREAHLFKNALMHIFACFGDTVSTANTKSLAASRVTVLSEQTYV